MVDLIGYFEQNTRTHPMDYGWGYYTKCRINDPIYPQYWRHPTFSRKDKSNKNYSDPVFEDLYVANANPGQTAFTMNYDARKEKLNQIGSGISLSGGGIRLAGSYKSSERLKRAQMGSGVKLAGDGRGSYKISNIVQDQSMDKVEGANIGHNNIKQDYPRPIFNKLKLKKQVKIGALRDINPTQNLKNKMLHKYQKGMPSPPFIPPLKRGRGMKAKSVAKSMMFPKKQKQQLIQLLRRLKK